MRFRLERFPKVSVVTPSFNQGSYLRETLASVVDQRYPSLELIVIDGGSTDGSLEVIRGFEPHIAFWESQRDRGQAHAINKGFEKATGDIVCWLNSDDVFLPGALNAVVYAFERDPGMEWLSAPSLKFGEGLHELSGFYELPRGRVEWLVHCPISQPSTFWSRKLYERHGGLDESFHYTLDYEYWIRFVFGGAQMRFMNRPLSAYRLHDVSKTVAQAEKFAEEEERLRDKYRPQLTPAEDARLSRLLARRDAVDQLAHSVALLNEGKSDEAREGVLRALRQKPGLLFTRVGAASLYRALANKPRYGG